MQDDLQSLSKGVFVIPFTPPRNVGPSRPSRPLRQAYDATFSHHQAAHEAYEAARTSELLDDIACWLDRCSATPLLTKSFSLHRLPVAIIQNIASSLPPLLSGLISNVHTLHGREATDIAGAIRAVAVGFVGEAALATKKTGRTGMDEVQRWYEMQKSRPPLLLHIEQAQLLPTGVLAELTYIFTLHPKLPLRLLLSVPSITTFSSSWTHIEPSSIDLSILQAGRGRRRGAAVNAIVQAKSPDGGPPLTITSDLEEELRRIEEMTGGGPTSALKSLKWLLLQHSVKSPLAQIAMTTREESNGGNDVGSGNLLSIMDAMQHDHAADLPGKSLLEVDAHSDLYATHDPAPRISIIHALSGPAGFTSPLDAFGQTGEASGSESAHRSPSPTPRKVDRNGSTSKSRNSTSSTKKRRTRRDASSPSPFTSAVSSREEVQNGDTAKTLAEVGDLGELETLFGLWRAAGRSVNLWDWLEGFRATTLGEKEEDQAEERTTSGEPPPTETNGDSSHSKRKRKSTSSPPVADDGVEPHDEQEKAARLHATFIRFCEEARMLGLVRARGKGVGRRGDEVLKGIGMV